MGRLYRFYMKGFLHFVPFFLSLSGNKEYVNEMESVECSLKQMGENVSALQGSAIPRLSHWGQDKLNEYLGRWDSLSKQVRKKFSTRNRDSYFLYLYAHIH